MKHELKVFDVPVDGHPVARAPTLAHECEVAGFRAIATPPGKVELSLEPEWHGFNVREIPAEHDLLKVGGQNLTRLRPIGEGVCWTPKDTDFRLACTNPGWELVVEIDPDRATALAHEALEGREPTQEFIFWRHDPIAAHTASLLIEHLRRPRIDRLYAEGLILATTARALDLAAGPLGAPSTAGTDRRITFAIDYIHDHLESSLAMVELAAAAGMSPWQFTRAFRAATGQSPYQYVINCRLDRARKLLALDDTPLAQVAVASGFASQSHMTDLFSRKLGVTPGRYRREARR